VVEVLGSATDPGMEIEIALRKARPSAPVLARREAPRARLPATVEEAYIKGASTCARCRSSRSTAKRRRTSTTRSIASVTERASACSSRSPTCRTTVRDGDALDVDARERGTSVYFPRRVIPMLPEALSNELCSLKADVDRLCMVCEMEINAHGAIPRFKFYKAVMRSRAGSPTRKSGALFRPARRRAPATHALLPQLRDLYALYKVLAAARERAARSTSTPSSSRSSSTSTARSSASFRGAQRCAQADRGMHAGGERLHRRVPREGRAPALYRVHEGPTPRSSRA
jgi:ribonuclease R